MGFVMFTRHISIETLLLLIYLVNDMLFAVLYRLKYNKRVF